MHAVELIGMPEAKIALAQAVVFMASAPKSNAVYKAYNMAAQDALNMTQHPVPLHLRNAPTKLMEEVGYGKGYKYAHDFPGNFVDQEFLPEKIAGTKLYDPANNATEARIREYLKNCWKEKYGY